MMMMVTILLSFFLPSSSLLPLVLHDHDLRESLHPRGGPLRVWESSLDSLSLLFSWGSFSPRYLTHSLTSYPHFPSRSNHYKLGLLIDQESFWQTSSSGSIWQRREDELAFPSSLLSSIFFYPSSSRTISPSPSLSFFAISMIPSSIQLLVSLHRRLLFPTLVNYSSSICDCKEGAKNEKKRIGILMKNKMKRKTGGERRWKESEGERNREKEKSWGGRGELVVSWTRSGLFQKKYWWGEWTTDDRIVFSLNWPHKMRRGKVREKSFSGAPKRASEKKVSET